MTVAPPVPLADPVCQERRGLLCFTVEVGDRRVDAFLSDAVWRACYGDSLCDVSLAERYRIRREPIDAAVMQRVRSGARDPVVLRHGDL